MSDPKEATPDAEAPRATTSSRTSPQEATASLPAETAASSYLGRGEVIRLPDTDEEIPVQPIVARAFTRLKAEVKYARLQALKVKTDDYEREKSRRAAKRKVDAEEAAQRAEEAGLGTLRDRVGDVDGFMDAEAPPPLVSDVLDGGGLSMLIGARGSFKTAVALCIALCIATGRGWGAHRTTRGRVLYVVGEGGGRAFGVRIEAWLNRHGVSRDEIRPWFRGVNGAAPFMSPAWDELVEFAAEYRPALVVIDTLARHQLGLEENSSTDSSDAIAKADALRARTGAAVMVLHHPPKGGGQSGRGSTAWEAAADSVFFLEKNEPVPGQVEMTTTKQKHRPETGRWAFRIEEVPVRENGAWPTSIVPVHADPFVVDAAEEQAKAAESAALDAEVLAFIGEREAAGIPVNKSDLREHFQASKRRTAALGALTRLLTAGSVRMVKGKHGAQRFHLVSEAVILPFTGRDEPDAEAGSDPALEAPK